MKTIAVIGLGQFGYQTAIGLTQKGFEVIAIDSRNDVVTEIKDFVAQAIILDSTDEKTMRSVHINNVDKAIVAIGTNVQSSLLTTALIQRMGVDDIIVRAINPLQESILKTMGIRNIVNIEKEMGIQVSNTMTLDKIERYIEISERHSLMETGVPKLLVGQTLKQLDVRSKYGVNIVGIKSKVPVINDEGDIQPTFKMTDVPDPNEPLKEDDAMVIFGSDENLRKFARMGHDET